MKTTTNYGLKKPESTDFYNVNDFNENFDAIDKELMENRVTEEERSVWNGKAEASHSQAASTITAGTLGGQVVANASAVADIEAKQVRNIYAGTTELVAGTSTLPAGDIYVQLKV